ncbi:MAG: M15 family metallopeptidase [Pseudomonadota bacterium]
MFKALLKRISSAACSLSLLVAPALACAPTDFLTIDLPAAGEDPVIASLLAGYTGLSYSAADSVLSDGQGNSVVYQGPTNRAPDTILVQPTIGDQFRYLYPVTFDLEDRKTPWRDPGRVRNQDFMKMLFFPDKRSARKSLTKVRSVDGNATFRVTAKHGVDCQLTAVLNALGTDFPKIFDHIGGSFNWRNISGTKRLSVHSFGAAVDVNSKIGGYWKWSGRPQGNAGEYRNQIPQKVVETFERYGFIWGGKWHHFDGMHFEYRPELIIYARLLARGS